MKNLIIILLFGLNSMLVAHTTSNTHNVFRKWKLSYLNQTIDGSFLIYKNGTIYIEDINNKIMKIPLTSFSKEDQAYAIKKNEWIKKLNKNIVTKKSITFENKTILNLKFWIIVSIIGSLIIYCIKLTDRRKLRFLIPIIIVGTTMTFYSFTKNSLKTLSSFTNTTFIDSAFAPFKPNVHTYWNSTYFYVESKGIPLHQMMIGIASNGWQQQVPIPQCYIGTNAWPIPLNPVIAATPVPVSPAHFSRGAIAIAANGVAIFNPYTNTGVDAFLDGQLDNFGGHCGRADDYHYHTAPLHLYSITSSTLPIAFALDGFAVYGSVEPDGSPMLSLDANHGHYRSGVYHYHGSAAAPYMIANMVGQVTEDPTFQIIPQAQASPVRPGQTPLPGALITNCQPNGTGNGYALTYLLSSQTHTVNYNWTLGGVYTFNFLYPTATSTSTYNGFVQCTVPTAINENKNENTNLLIYPNPTNDLLLLKFNDAIQEKDVQSISIYNIDGDLVYKTEEFKKNIDIKKYSKGTYILQIQMSNFQITKKVLVQ